MSEVQGAGAPQSQDQSATTEEASDFDKDFAAFLGHSFADPEPEESSGDPPVENEPQASGTPATPAASVAPAPQSTPAPAAAPANAETPAASHGTPAETPTSEIAPAAQPAAAAIDPADLAAMIGLGAEPAGPAGEDRPAPTRSDPASSAPSADETFTPFKPEFQLPPALVSGLFEADDTETRARSLVQLLSAFGNTITQTMEQRMREHHYGAIQSQVNEGLSQLQGRQVIESYMWGKYPELQAYRPAVMKALRIVAAKDMNRPTTPELFDEVANLVHATLAQSGVKVERKTVPAPATSAPKTVKKTPVSKAPGNGFEAGGSRPAGVTETEDENSPTNLVRQLSEFG